MRSEFDSIILATMFRYITPFILTYSVYVLFHGEYSPGGAFQAGGMFGMAIVLERLIQKRDTILFLPARASIILAGIGMFIFVFLGILPMFAGGNFLEYGALPFGLPNLTKHSLGVVAIEIGIAICVAATIMVIFDALYEGKE